MPGFPNHAVFTPRLVLRPIVDSDIHKVFEGLSHPEVIRYYGVSYQTLEATAEQMKWFRQLEEENAGKWWAICVQETSDFAGAIGFNNHEPAHKKLEIGFWLLPVFWKRGLMAEALECAVEMAFSAGIQIIQAEAEPENKGCLRLLERAGFRFKKKINNAEIKNGQPIHLLIFERSNPLT